MKALTSDRKIGYAVAFAALAASILSLFVPGEFLLWAAGAIFALTAAGAYTLIKKRSIHSYNKDQVLLIVAVIAALYITLLYLSGFEFGFARSPGGVLSLGSFAKYILPTALIIAGSELLRSVLLAEKNPAISFIAYLIGALSVVAISGEISSFRTSYQLADFLGMTVFPALTSNLFFNYTSRRYGILPNLVYRLILSLYEFIIPVVPNTPAIILAFGLMVLPLISLFFISALFEKKRKRAKERGGKWQMIPTVVVAVIMILIVMLVTCQFRFGILVIATESMTGEINKGDAVVFEDREHCGEIAVGDVIVFEESNKRLVHRVVEINTVNGERQYITRGDANEGNDPGYRTDSSILGKVRFKVLYIGLPTIWLREALSKY